MLPATVEAYSHPVFVYTKLGVYIVTVRHSWW